MCPKVGKEDWWIRPKNISWNAPRTGENTIWKIKTWKIWERRWWQVSVVGRGLGSRVENVNRKHQQGAVPRSSSWKNTRRESQRAGGKDPCILHLFSDPGTLEPLQDVWVFSAYIEQLNNFSWESSFPPYSTSEKPTNFYAFPIQQLWEKHFIWIIVYIAF